MKRILNAWYELTVIPAIVLGCLTALGWSLLNWLQYGILSATLGDAATAFLLFLAVMTAEDIYKATKLALQRAG
jgi:hypothetical protein